MFAESLIFLPIVSTKAVLTFLPTVLNRNLGEFDHEGRTCLRPWYKCT